MAATSDVHGECMNWLWEKGGALGQTVLANAHVVLPPLAIYILQGSYSLRVWAAARHTSALPDSKPKNHGDVPGSGANKLNIMAKILSFMNIFWFELAAVVCEFVLPPVFCYVVASLLRPELGFAYTLCASIFFGAFTFYVKHVFIVNFSGKMVVRRFSPRFVAVYPVQQRKYYTILLSVLAIIISFFGVIYDNAICLVLLYMATLRFIGDVRVQQVQSFRNITIGLIIVSAFVTIFNVFFLIYPESNTVELPVGEDGIILNVFEALFKYTGLFGTILAAAFPQALISICYRFDNYNSILSSNNLDAETSTYFLENSPIGPSIRIPEHLSKKFLKPYFITSILAWAVTNVVMLILVGFNWVQLEEPVLGFGLVTAAISMPVMLYAIAVLAAVRGELKSLWAYKEEWGVPPQEPEAPEAELLLDHVNEEA